MKNEREKTSSTREPAEEQRDERRKRDAEGIPGRGSLGGAERRLAMKSSRRNFKVSFHSFTSEKKNLDRAQAHYPSALLVSSVFSFLYCVPFFFFFLVTQFK